MRDKHLNAFNFIGQFQEVALWVEEDAIALFGLNTSKAPALLPGSGDALSGSTTDSSFVYSRICSIIASVIFFLGILQQLKNSTKCFQQVSLRIVSLVLLGMICFRFILHRCISVRTEKTANNASHIIRCRVGLILLEKEGTDSSTDDPENTGRSSNGSDETRFRAGFRFCCFFH